MKLHSLLSLSLAGIALAPFAASQTEAPAWLDFAHGQATGTPALLPDYSYAGYRFSEKAIPDTSTWRQLDVTDFGAIPGDNLMDDDGIQAALDAAHAISEPVVLNFPAGKYIVCAAKERNRFFKINRSHFVLKGAGAGEGGTEIYAHDFREENLPEKSRFEISPVGVDRKKTDSTVLATSTSEIPRGSFSLQVDDTSKLAVGTYVTLFHQSTEAIDARLNGLEWHPDWNTGKAGIRIHEEHLISAIDGNRVTFKNPVQLGIPAGAGTTQLWPYQPIEEVGIEGIRFSSGWAHYPQTFKHHLNWEVDYAHRGIHFTNVANSWVRDCDFESWNVALVLDSTLATTVENVRFSGKPGHATTYSRDSYGVLFKGLVNESPSWHGIGFRWATTASVYQNCLMLEDQSVDCHGYHPYANLVDNVRGGRFTHNGGNWGSYPNSGQDFTFWNFTHNASAEQTDYDFWSTEVRKLHNYLRPNFIGFRSSGETVTFEDEGLDQLRGEEVYPLSLFDAQLQLRLYGSYLSASNAATDHPANLANDGDSNTLWVSRNESALHWLQIDLGVEKSVSGVRIQEPWNNAQTFTLEAWTGDSWKTVANGDSIGPALTLNFATTTTRKLRLSFPNTKVRDYAVAIAEFKAIID